MKEYNLTINKALTTKIGEANESILTPYYKQCVKEFESSLRTYLIAKGFGSELKSIEESTCSVSEDLQDASDAFINHFIKTGEELKGTKYE